MKDWTGDRNSIFKTLGASNHTDKERQQEDYYATHPIAAEWLTYVQEADGNDIEQDEQNIIISTEDCPGSDLDYYFIIETKRWFINDAQDLADLINDFKNRLTLISNE